MLLPQQLPVTSTRRPPVLIVYHEYRHAAITIIFFAAAERLRYAAAAADAIRHTPLFAIRQRHITTPMAMRRRHAIELRCLIADALCLLMPALMLRYFSRFTLAFFHATTPPTC